MRSTNDTSNSRSPLDRGMLALWAGLCMAAALLVSEPAHAADTQYVYDVDGRLVTVIAPNGDSAQYTYDPAGNIKTIQRHAVGALWLGDFSPATGPAGTSVVIRGGGFSTTAANNTVKFNGTSATVTAAAANQLTATVPAAATTGPISVTVGGSTVTTTANFNVGNTGAGAPSITSFNPTEGSPGTVVTITGTRFDPDRANNFVMLNGRTLPITSASATQLQVTIPVEATSGRFSVKTPQGSTTGTGDFYVTPSGIDPLTILKRGRLAVDGASVAVSNLDPAKYVHYVFDASAGQSLGLGFSAFTFVPTGGTIGVTIRRPDGATYTATCSISESSNSGGCRLGTLPKTGTYSLLVRADSSRVTNFTMTLSSDVGGTLTPNAPTPTLFTTARVGQNARYSFSGTAGKQYTVVPSEPNIVGTWTYFYIYGPDGAELASTYAGSGYTPNPVDFTAPTTGTYTVLIDPYLGNTGDIKVALRQSATGTLAVDGAAAVLNLATGQNAIYTFTGNSGKKLGLGISQLTSTPSGGTVTAKVYGPTGAQVADCTANATSGGECDLLITATGTHTVKLDPSGSYATSFTVTLSNDVSGTLTVNAPSATLFSTSRPGQNARYTFAAKTGKSYSLVFSDVTIPGTWTYIYVYGPTGAQVASLYVGQGYTPGSIEIPNVSANGTYSVFIDPYAGNVGQVGIALRQTTADTIAVDGTPVAASLLDGQTGRYTFNGTTGQRLGLGISSIATVPAGKSVTVKVYTPTGAVLIDCGNYTANNECDLPALPLDGKYIVEADPNTTSSATFTLTLSSDVQAVLPFDGATPLTFATTRNGQNGRYRFTAELGKNYSITVSDATFADTQTYVRVLASDGTELGNTTTGSGRPPAVIDIVNAPTDGSYTVFVDPYQGNTGQVNLALRKLVVDTMAIDGTPTAVTLLSGQNGRYTFNGTSGQRLGLGISSVLTTPGGGNVSVKLVGPTGAVVYDCGSNSVASECDLPALPASGKYALQVDPASTNAASLTLTLSNDMAAALQINAATPHTVDVTRNGQNGRYTYAGTAGKSYTLDISDVTIPGNYTYIYVYAPDGTELVSRNYAAGSTPTPLEVATVAATGTYSVFVDPKDGNTGQIKIALREIADGTLSVDGAPTATSLLNGQNGRYTFSGTAGQRLGYAISAISTVPSGGYIYTKVYGPTGTQLIDCSGTSSGAECDIPPLPSTGTYTVQVDPSGSNSAAFTMTLSNDLTAALTVGAPAHTFTTARAGQNGNYTFNGTAGRNYSVVLSDVTIPGNYTYVYVRAPDGTDLATGATAQGSAPPTINVPNVPATGTYSVFVNPKATNVGQLKLAVNDTGNTDPTPQTPDGAIAIDGANLVFNVPAGATHRFTFSGTAGARLGLGITGVATVPAGQSVRVLVKRTDNATTLTDCSNISSTGGCRIAPLPATGTYTVWVTPNGGATGSGTLTLSTDSGGALPLNDPTPTLFQTARAGQNGRYTFSGQAGRTYSIVVSDNTIVGSYTYVYLYGPDGAQLSSAGISAGGSTQVIKVQKVAATGTYSVVVDPYLAATGQLNLALRENVSSNIAVDGAALPINLLSSQEGAYAFTGTAGQRLGIGVSAPVTVPAGASVVTKVLTPSGATLLTCSSASLQAECDVPPLPVAGSYVLQVEPGSGASASLTLTASNDKGNTLTANAAPTTFTTTRAGQNGRYTFNGQVGKTYAVTISDSTIPGSSSWAYLYAPDGTQLDSGSFTTSSSSTLRAAEVKATGTYTVFIDPYQGNVGQVAVGLREIASGTLVVDGAALPVNLVSAQSARYTFAGTAGQQLGLGLSAISTVPANSSITVKVLGPTGALVATCSPASNVTDSECDLTPLPATGDYALTVEPSGAASVSMTATLSSDVVSTLPINGQNPKTHTAVRAGQNGRYTFQGQTGKYYTLVISDSTIPSGATAVTVYAPSGASVASDTLSVGDAPKVTDLPSAPETGTYTVFVDPYRGYLGQINLLLRDSATGTLAIDGTPTLLDLKDGQNARYKFKGTVGQRLGLAVTNVSTSPLGSTVGVTVYNPNGTTVATCSTSSATSCDLSNLTTAGDHWVFVNPPGTNLATATLTLSNDIAADLAPNSGTPVEFNTARPGQQGWYALTVQAGERIGLAFQDASFVGYYSYFTLYKPDGSSMGNQMFGSTMPRGFVDFGTAPATGTYHLFVEPYGTSTGLVRFYPTKALTMALTVDAAPVPVVLSTGRMAEFTFAGSAGQNLGAILRDVATAPDAPATDPMTMDLLSPSGATLESCTLGSPSNSSCRFPTLVDSGTYKLVLRPKANSATFQINIRSTL